MRFKVKYLKSFFNKTGSLTPFYIDKTLENFKIKRFFFLQGKKKYLRANHAHKKCDQIYIPVHGEMTIKVIKKNMKKSFYKLSFKKKKILFIPKFTWTSIKFHKNNSVLLVLCNYQYDRKEYIENINELKK